VRKPVDENSANQAAEIAAQTGIRSMDALVVQVAKEFGSKLISFDKEMIAIASRVLS
jgi:predicted nucleic acid-binding protein